MRRQAGFSLLELLVALALLSVIAMGLAGAMRLGAETYSRAQDLGGQTEEIEARTQLRRLLARAFSPTLSATSASGLSGTRESLSFVTLAPTGIAKNAFSARISVSRDDDTLVLSLSALTESGETLDTFQTVLAHRVDDMEISYFHDGTWRDAWTEANALPDLVSIDLGDATQPYWPDFTVALIHAN